MAFPYLAAAQLGLGVAQSLFGNKGGSSMPTFNPQQALDFQSQQFNQMSPQALGFGRKAFNQAQQQGIDFSKLGTATNIANQEAVMPGSQAQRELAQNQINAYIQGQVPQDVQQQIQRNVAQGVGGGFNLFSGGGQAPQNFARNIGQTSVGLSQFGLSAAPTWQQLANSMVVSPTAGLSAGLQATGMGSQLAGAAANIGMQLAENQYQSQANQYGAQQAQQQYGNTMLNQSLGNFANTLASQDKSGYLSTISKFGGLPATGYGAYAQPGGAYYQPGTSVMVPTFG